MDKRGNLWISTDGGGVSCIDRGWRTVEQFTATPLSHFPKKIISLNKKLFGFVEKSKSFFIKCDGRLYSFFL